MAGYPRRSLQKEKPTSTEQEESDHRSKHPLAESQEKIKYKLLLFPVPIILLGFLSRWLVASATPVDDLVRLYKHRGVELGLGILGTILVLSDVVGTARMKKLDHLIYKTLTSGVRKIFLVGAIERARSYLKAYKGPGFWYERDVFISVVILYSILRLFGWNIFQGRQFLEIILPIAIWALGTHSLYRLFVKDTHVLLRFVTASAYILMVFSTVPLTLARFLLYLWMYLIYLPFDIVSTLSMRMKIEGYLKIVGGLLLISTLVLVYLRE